MKIKVLSLLILLIILLTSTLLIRIKNNILPEREVNKAIKMLSEAQSEKCPVYSKELFLEAKMNYDSALIEWKLQNEQIIFFRNFKKVSDYAKKSAAIAETAILLTKDTLSITTESLQKRIKNLGSEFDEFDKYFVRFLSTKEHRDEYTASKLLFSEGKHTLKKSNYSNCIKKLEAAEKTIHNLRDYYTIKLKEYFEEYPKWEKMVKESILLSKNNHAFTIVVDKYSKKLILYKNGFINNTFSIELGTGQLGNKLQKGDKFTPEGFYKISDKKQGQQTKYYKAFLLNYPNDEDKKRFSANKKNGIIRCDAKIGNLIEIHGKGGKGIDWTNGCIALSDTDMDVLYKLCPKETGITIVGSTKPLHELSIIKK